MESYSAADDNTGYNVPFEGFDEQPKHPWLLSPKDAAAARRQKLSKDIAVCLNHNARWVAGNAAGLVQGVGKPNLKMDKDPYGVNGLFRAVLYK